MPKTVVGLFENPRLVNEVVTEIEALGFPRQEVRSLAEPGDLEVTGLMSFPRLDFQVALNHGLTRIGASEAEAQAFVKGLQRGGTLVFATGPDDKVKVAAEVMNRNGAVGIETGSGPEPRLPGVARESGTPMGNGPVLAGRIREPGGGARFFVW